jgi:hypothetical protein
MESGRFRRVTLPHAAERVASLGTTPEMSPPSSHLRRVSGAAAGYVRRVGSTASVASCRSAC